jgi:signal peptidase II
MRWRWLLAPLLVVLLGGCDQVTKHVASLELRDASVPLIGGVLDLTYAENRDVGFGLLRMIESDDIRRAVILTAGLTLLAFLLYMLARARHAALTMRIGLALVAAGAVGNLIDRIARGYVVDFIHLHHWPVFNVSDCCLVAGGALIVIDAIRTQPSPRRGAPH